MDAAEIRSRYAEQLSLADDGLFEWAASVVGVPKRAPADSFVLHAPLELMARKILLDLVAPDDRQRARERLVAMVDAYVGAGEDVEPPRAVAHASIPSALGVLTDAIRASNLDEIDRHASWLGVHATAAEMGLGLSAICGPSLAAAAHESIALHLMRRTPRIGPSLLRGTLREVGRHPDWVVPWEGLSTGDEPLIDVLLETPLLGMPDSIFILPMVFHGTDTARRMLAATSPDGGHARRALSRVAAWSMVQDTSAHVPYGWTHALTIPQAVLSLNLDQVQAVSIGASQLIGFRASMGTLDLDPSRRLPTPAHNWKELASKAPLHFDAHVVKYTLAAYDAAKSDPEETDLYLAAANRLHEWWASIPSDDFF